MTPPTTSNLWSGLGTLDSMMDFTSPISLFQNIVQGKVLSLFMTGKLGTDGFVYAGIVMMMIMTYVASAYVIVCTINAGVSISQGFYYNYAKKSSFGDYVAIFELILILGWEFWGLVQVILVTWLGSDFWTALDARMKEAKDGSIGLENALTWGLAIKTFSLTMLVGIVMVIVGFSLGDMAETAIPFYDKYDDKTKEEADKKTDSSDEYPTGTSAQYDIIYHFVTAVGGMFILGMSGILSYAFAWQFLNLGDDGFICDLDSVDKATYAAVYDIIPTITDYESCTTNIMKIFDIMDLNKNNMLERCEDAKFQYAMGSSKEYALKFSSPYTRASTESICLEDFKKSD